MKAGIYPGLDYEAIHEIPALSFTSLKRWINPDEKEIDKKLSDFGKAFHLAVLEPAKLRDVVRVGPDVNMRTRQGKEDWSGFESMVGDDQIAMRPKDALMLRSMVESVDRNDHLGMLRNKVKDTGSEKTYVWRDIDSGVWLKAVIDQHTDRSVIDWKTTGATTFEDFEGAISKYGYDIQAAMYLDGYQWHHGDGKQFLWAACSKRGDKGHPCWVHRSTDRNIDTGRRIYKPLLKVFARYHPDHVACQAWEG